MSSTVYIPAEVVGILVHLNLTFNYGRRTTAVICQSGSNKVVLVDPRSVSSHEYREYKFLDSL